MKLYRRDFLKLGALQATILGVPSYADQKAAYETSPKNGPSIMQGATDGTRTQFSIVHQANSDFEVSIYDSNGSELPIDKVESLTMPSHSKKIVKVFVSGLWSKELFTLLLTHPSGELLDRRTFRTLDESKGKLNFAVCSCMKESFHEPKIWRELVEEDPDLIFFIGDSVYADQGTSLGYATPTHLWKRFCSARSVLDIYFSEHLIPIIAVWDDHDFGKNDSDATYVFAKESMVNFLSFFAQDPSHCTFLKRGPGISSITRIGNHQFVLMDCRSFREPNGSKGRYAHWGQEQENWLLELIKNFDGATYIMNGSQFFPNLIWKESFSRDHSSNLKSFINELRALGNHKIVFVSGDVHYSEISKVKAKELGYETIEITSSSIHSVAPPGFPTLAPNTRRLASTGRRNFVLIESEFESGHIKATIESRSKDQQINFSMKINI